MRQRGAGGLQGKHHRQVPCLEQGEERRGRPRCACVAGQAATGQSPAGPAHPLGAVFDSSAHTPSAERRPALSVAALVQEAPWRFASAGRSAPKLPGAAAASSAAGLFFEFFLQCLCRCPLPFANAVTSGKLFNLLNLGFHVSKKRGRSLSSGGQMRMRRPALAHRRGS